jgi:hypothetical protein
MVREFILRQRAPLLWLICHQTRPKQHSFDSVSRILSQGLCYILRYLDITHGMHREKFSVEERLASPSLGMMQSRVTPWVEGIQFTPVTANAICLGCFFTHFEVFRGAKNSKRRSMPEVGFTWGRPSLGWHVARSRIDLPPRANQHLSAIILTTCSPSNPTTLWEKYKEALSEEYSPMPGGKIRH